MFLICSSHIDENKSRSCLYQLHHEKVEEQLTAVDYSRYMLIFWKARLVFLAVPKTGTSAYESALGNKASAVISDPPELKHAPFYRYCRFIRPAYRQVMNAEMDTMAVIREPVSWLGSWYRYRRRPFMKGRVNSTHDINFDTFINEHLRGNPPSRANVGRQSRFVGPTKDGERVTHLFKYEDQMKIIEFLQDRLQCQIDLGTRNESPSEILTYSPQTHAKLERKYAAEFELWSGLD